MSLANPLRKVASKLMAKFGGVVTIRRITMGAYNTATGTATETTNDTIIRGILEDINIREVDNLIQAGDKRLTIAAADLTTAPTTADKVLIASVVHQVIRITTIEQDNIPISHNLILRV